MKTELEKLKAELLLFIENSTEIADELINSSDGRDKHQGQGMREVIENLNQIISQ